MGKEAVGWRDTRVRSYAKSQHVLLQGGGQRVRPTSPRLLSEKRVVVRFGEITVLLEAPVKRLGTQ